MGLLNYLARIPPETFDYRLGYRSALDWPTERRSSLNRSYETGRTWATVTQH